MKYKTGILKKKSLKLYRVIISSRNVFIFGAMSFVSKSS
jgi:hypothetical protein